MHRAQPYIEGLRHTVYRFGVPVPVQDVRLNVGTLGVPLKGGSIRVAIIRDV